MRDRMDASGSAASLYSVSRPSGSRRAAAASGRRVLLAIAVVVPVLSACRPAKADGSAFLGKWAGLTAQGGTGATYDCPLAISQNGASFIVRIDSADNTDRVVCSDYEGIYVLTPEGNLKGGPLGTVLFSLDKAEGQLILSAGGGLRTLHRPMDADLAAKLADSIASCISSGRTACLAELHASGSNPKIVQSWATDVARYKDTLGVRVVAIGPLDERWVGPSLREEVGKGVVYPGQPVGQIQISGGGDGRTWGVMFGRFGDRYLLMRPVSRKP